MKKYIVSAFLLLSCIGLETPVFAQNTSNLSYPSTLTVAADGSGDYSTISAAISKFRAYSPVPLKLVIKNGIYKEKIVIPSWLCNLTITGESAEGVIITYDDYSGKKLPEGADTSNGLTKFSTFNSYTLLIAGDNIRLENLTIENSAGRVGQAVALHVEGDRCAVVNCRLKGNQDTLFTGNGKSRQYYKDCWIEGTTDFIFGPATAVFDHCQIRNLNDSYITAASTPEGKQFGYVFLDCELTAAPEVNKAYLGRPWRKYAKTVWLNCTMGKHIVAEGWDNWGEKSNEATVFYAEYISKGEGAHKEKRAAWSHQLKKADAAAYTVKNIFKDWQP